MGYTSLDYTSYSMWDLVNQIINKLKEGGGGWQDTYASGVGQKMIEHLAYVANLVLYSVERRAEESYLDTAQLRSSVVSLVKLLNYTPTRATSSTGTLTFTLAGAHAKNVYLPKGTKCESLEGFTFSTTEAKYISAGDTTATVNAIQGEYGEILVTSDGMEDQFTNIPFTNVENTSIVIVIDTSTWTCVSSLLNFVDTDLHYTETHESDDTVTIHFGNNITGKIPPLNSEINFSFVKTDGASGNVFEADKIVTITDTIYDVDSAEVTDISVKNDGQYLGGGATEETEHIRYYAPRLFAAGQRAVTKEDYKALINSYAGIADSNVWGEFEDGSSPNFDLYNVVKICLVLENWQTADPAFKTDLGDYLKDYSMLTVKYEFEDPYFVKATVNTTVLCEAGADLSLVRSNVQYQVESLFVAGTTSMLGQKKYLSDIHKIINAVDKVTYSNSVLKIEEDMVYNVGNLRWEKTVQVLEIQPGTVEIWGKVLNEAWLKIGKDNNFNDIETVTGSVHTVTGHLDYDTTGETWVEVSPNNLDQVKMRYVQPDGNVDVTKNQICRLQEISLVVS